MRERVKFEFQRIEAILRGQGFGSSFKAPTPMELINEAEAATEIRFDEGLRALYELANGSANRTCLAVYTDELTPCSFAPIQEAVTWWREWLPYDEKVHQKFWGALNEHKGDPLRDARIQPDCFVHRRWFPFAEFNGWSTAVYFDADPTPLGTYGQIIAYQHDPEAVYYLAKDIGEFLRKSNDSLEIHAKELLYCDGRPSAFSPPRLKV